MKYIVLKIYDVLPKNKQFLKIIFPKDYNKEADEIIAEISNVMQMLNLSYDIKLYEPELIKEGGK